MVEDVRIHHGQEQGIFHADQGAGHLPQVAVHRAVRDDGVIGVVVQVLDFLFYPLQADRVIRIRPWILLDLFDGQIFAQWRAVQIVITGDQAVRDSPLVHEFLELPDHRIGDVIFGRADVNKAEVCAKPVEHRVVIRCGVKTHQRPPRYILHPKMIPKQNISLFRQVVG
jgi:hypothetical protein